MHGSCAERRTGSGRREEGDDRLVARLATQVVFVTTVGLLLWGLQVTLADGRHAENLAADDVAPAAAPVDPPQGHARGDQGPEHGGGPKPPADVRTAKPYPQESLQLELEHMHHAARRLV